MNTSREDKDSQNEGEVQLKSSQSAISTISEYLFSPQSSSMQLAFFHKAKMKCAFSFKPSTLSFKLLF